MCDDAELPAVDAQLFEFRIANRMRVQAGSAEVVELPFKSFEFLAGGQLLRLCVGDLRAQKALADTMRETGTYYWVQTPSRSFPIEPHFYFPFFAYLPLSLRTFLHQRFSLGFMDRNPNWLEARMTCEQTRLLTRAELAAIFDGCRILEERLLGVCKSYVATNMVERAGTPGRV